MKYLYYIFKIIISKQEAKTNNEIYFILFHIFGVLVMENKAAKKSNFIRIYKNMYYLATFCATLKWKIYHEIK